VILFVAFVLLLFGTFFLAWWKGGAPERIAASMFLIAWLVSVALYASDIGRYANTSWIGPTLQVSLAIGLFFVARFANRSWPMLATSLQLLIILAMIGRRLRPEWMWQVYMLMIAAWPYLQLAVLLAGVLFHWRREVLNGPEPSWSRSWTKNPAAAR
jgi:hypothetical protein